MTQPVDFYAVLGVSPTATSDEIKAAYRQAAKRTHPDLNPGAGANEEDFKRVSQAFETLKDAHKRYVYDRSRADGIGGSSTTSGADAASDFAWTRWAESADTAARRARREEERRREEAEAINWWAAQKADAEANKAAFRAAAARASSAADARRVRVLSQLWHTRAGVLWQDAAAFLALGASLAYAASLAASARRATVQRTNIAATPATEAAPVAAPAPAPS